MLQVLRATLKIHACKVKAKSQVRVRRENMPNIILVGFMGTGKTSVGQRLSQRLKMSYVDTDEVIEQNAGRCITDIFAEHGEAYFREVESEAVHKVSRLDKYVISTGGGIVLRTENMEILKRNGVVFCLTATSEEIWARVKNETHRPLLRAPNPVVKIRDMLKAREPYYALADYTVQTNGVPIEQVTNEVAEVFQNAINSR